MADEGVTPPGPSPAPVTGAKSELGGAPGRPRSRSKRAAAGALGLNELDKLTKSGPPWAQGLAVVLAALVAVVLAFHIDIGGMISGSQGEVAKQNERVAANAAARIAADQAAAQTAAQLEHDSADKIIGALNAALQSQNVRLAELTTENQRLTAEALKLQLQNEQISFRCGLAVLTPTVVP